jgi:hypothetical protein
VQEICEQRVLHKDPLSAGGAAVTTKTGVHELEHRDLSVGSVKVEFWREAVFSFRLALHRLFLFASIFRPGTRRT